MPRSLRRYFNLYMWTVALAFFTFLAFYASSNWDLHCQKAANNIHSGKAASDIHSEKAANVIHSEKAANAGTELVSDKHASLTVEQRNSNCGVETFSAFSSVWHEEKLKVDTVSQDKMNILFWTEFHIKRLETEILPEGRRHLCRHMPQCTFSRYPEDIHNADAVFFENSNLPRVYNATMMPQIRYSHQHWIWFNDECPNFPSIDFDSYRSIFNWTITYRGDSDSTSTYGSLFKIYKRLRDEAVEPNMNYAAKKKKLAVWFITKCNTQANRMAYATELVKYIHIDVFGGCGKAGCKKWNVTCMPGIIENYKFYLAFENNKCKEYITEKFWRNALGSNTVPVVLGASRADFKRLAPPNSYIHVDDFTSPKELAEYLKVLDKDNDKYNSYFTWKTNVPKNIPLDEGIWCNLCRKLLQSCPTRRKVYTDLKTWFQGENLSMCEPIENVTFHQLEFVNNRFRVVPE